MQLGRSDGRGGGLLGQPKFGCATSMRPVLLDFFLKLKALVRMLNMLLTSNRMVSRSMGNYIANF